MIGELEEDMDVDSSMDDNYNACTAPGGAAVPAPAAVPACCCSCLLLLLPLLMIFSGTCQWEWQGVCGGPAVTFSTPPGLLPCS